MAYKTFIAATINNNKCYFDLDTCTERSLSSNATIPQYPVESGVTVSDHMYRNPRNLALTGMFSLNRGNTENYYTLANITGGKEDGSAAWASWFENEGGDLKQLDVSDRMTAVQTLFEWIQAKGVLCDIYMVDRSSADEKTRFKARHNMALQSISWRESYNSMSYTFSFTEVISISPLSSFEVYSYSDLYPNVNLPAARSLGEVLIDTGNLITLVLQTLVESGYISEADCKALVLNGDTTKGGELKSFIQSVLNVFKSELFSGLLGLAIGAGVAVTGAIATGIIAGKMGIAVSVGAAAGPVGWIILGAALLGAAIGVTVGKISQAKKEARLHDGFNLIKNYRQYIDPKTLAPIKETKDAILNLPDFARLRVLIDDIAAGLNNTFQDLTFYQLSTTESELGDCEMPLQVGNDILTVVVNKNTANDSNPYKLSFVRGSGTSETPVPSLFGSWPVCATVYEMKSNANMVYKDTSRQYQMYLLNPYLGITEGEEYELAFRNASYYYLVVYRGNIEDAVKKIDGKIVEILTNGGYAP